MRAFLRFEKRRCLPAHAPVPSFVFFYFSESGLFKGLRAKEIKNRTPYELACQVVRRRKTMASRAFAFNRRRKAGAIFQIICSPLATPCAASFNGNSQ
jgi:hypothetical protein